MSPDAEKELIAVLGRVADNLERLANRWASEPRTRPSRPAHLGVATYNPEERERQELKAKLKGGGLAGHPAGKTDSDHLP